MQITLNTGKAYDVKLLPSNIFDELLTNEGAEPEVWIFGYGSLMWFPGFDFETSRKGAAPGYVRRFYQGNTTYRGSNELPGRVATLLESECPSDQTFGILFKVSGWGMVLAALEHLYEREVQNGYAFQWIQVQDLHTKKCIQALTCIAQKTNSAYLGPSGSLGEEARQIAEAKGCKGPNVDYLMKLAEFARKLFPEVDDDHLYGLERLVLAIS